MQKDPLVTTVRERYGLNINEIIDPYAAAIASMVSFPTGSLLPMLAITLFPRKDQDHSNIYRGFDRFSLDWLRGSYFK